MRTTFTMRHTAAASGLLLLILLSACGMPTAADTPATAGATSTAVPIEQTGSTTSPPAAIATTTAEPLPAVFLWPTTLPAGFTIQRDGSGNGGEGGFQLALAETERPEHKVFIHSMGTGYDGPRGPDVTVHDQPAQSFQTAAGWSVVWQENSNIFTVGQTITGEEAGGFATLDEAVAFANSLELIDYATWQARLDALP